MARFGVTYPRAAAPIVGTGAFCSVVDARASAGLSIVAVTLLYLRSTTRPKYPLSSETKSHSYPTRHRSHLMSAVAGAPTVNVVPLKVMVRVMVAACSYWIGT